MAGTREIGARFLPLQPCHLMQDDATIRLSRALKMVVHSWEEKVEKLHADRSDREKVGTRPVDTRRSEHFCLRKIGVGEVLTD